jgi:ATP-dependent helicase/nuclease subunit B
MATRFIDSARAFLTTTGTTSPDLSRYTVLVPHYHAVQPFVAALRHEMAAPVFMPPRCYTLPAWAAEVATHDPVPMALRLARLYDALRKQHWLPEGAACWGLARTLLDLIEELDAANLQPPASAAVFSAQLATIERRYTHAPLAMEAALIFALWRADHSENAGHQRVYAQQLATRIHTTTAPVFLLGLSELSGLERRALQQLAERVSVVDLPTAVRFPERAHALRVAWATDTATPLRDRAAALAADMPHSPFQDALQYYAATDLEDEAQTAALWVHQRIAAGDRHIALIALDRLAARRLRALLERSDILIQDETGWSFPTTVVSHVIDRWQALFADDFYHRTVLDFLSSPYCLADLSAFERQQAIAELNTVYVRTGVVRGLDAIKHVTDERTPIARAVLARLHHAAQLFHPQARTLADWLARLDELFIRMGITPALEADSAGQQLLHLLATLKAAVAPPALNNTRYQRSEWAAWLAQGLEAANYQETHITSTVRLTHLAAARMRDFDAVLCLGADARYLPREPTPSLLADAVRGELGIPGRAEHAQRALAALSDILARANRVLLTWQAQVNGDANSPAPDLLRLDTVHTMAWGKSLYTALPRTHHAPTADLPSPRYAIAAATLPRLPEKLSASAWQALIRCPYQYFARYGLGLDTQDEVIEEMAKKDYGICVHRILAEFHTTHATLNASERAALEAELRELTQKGFSTWTRYALPAYAWQARWEAILPAYLDWAIAYSAHGHHCIETEQSYSTPLPLDDGHTITLYGRIDRCDDGPNGRAVIDYKTQAHTALQQQIHPDQEAIQLPFYGLLTGAAEALFVGVDDPEQTRSYAAPAPFVDAVQAETERLHTTFSALAAGHPLPAHGIEEACKYCSVRGLCRKDDRGVHAPDAA